MSRTHHATRAFRLSCNCLRDYTGMPAGLKHEVLCPACGVAAVTLYDYPDRICGVRQVAENTRHMCTQAPGNTSCQAGVHHDSLTGMTFRTPGAIRKKDEGLTRKA